MFPRFGYVVAVFGPLTLVIGPEAMFMLFYPSSANSLFAIPKNEEFVYLSPASESHSARDVSALVRGLVSMCSGAEPPPAAAADRPSFKQFLMGHVELALAQGFDDNVGKYAMSTSFFEVGVCVSRYLKCQIKLD